MKIGCRHSSLSGTKVVKLVNLFLIRAGLFIIFIYFYFVRMAILKRLFVVIEKKPYFCKNNS